MMSSVEKVDVVIVGAGQAGLAVGRELSGLGIEHLILERGRVAQTWRGRWDSFCLVTPNWAIDLPGAGYDGHDPDGYMPRDDIVAYFERYAGGGDSPVRGGVEVTQLHARAEGFALDTSDGGILASSVVACTGAYQRPHRPPGSETLPERLLAINATEYRSPDALPSGDVLIIGSGQTGCQLAEELHGAGRRVVLSCGRAPWVPRRLGERDIVWWSIETGFLDQPVTALPDPRARLGANLLATGRDGGHDLNLRTLADSGVTLAGHFRGADGEHAHFAGDLADCVAWGDERYGEFMNLVRRLAEERRLAIDLPEPSPFEDAGPTELELAGFSSVIFAGGFRPDYGSWIDIPEAFDDLGFPRQTDGASTVVEGLHFAGVHFMRKRKSAILLGAREDAGVVADRIAARFSRRPRTP